MQVNRTIRGRALKAKLGVYVNDMPSRANPYLFNIYNVDLYADRVRDKIIILLKIIGQLRRIAEKEGYDRYSGYYPRYTDININIKADNEYKYVVSINAKGGSAWRYRLVLSDNGRYEEQGDTQWGHMVLREYVIPILYTLTLNKQDIENIARNLPIRW